MFDPWTPDQIQQIAWKACLRKQNLSEETANRIVDQAASEGNVVYFYKCTLCLSFHITGSPPLPEDKLNLKFQ